MLFAVAGHRGAVAERARNAIKMADRVAPETAEIADGSMARASVRLGSHGQPHPVRAGARVQLDARVDGPRRAGSGTTRRELAGRSRLGNLLYAGSLVTDGVVEATVPPQPVTRAGAHCWRFRKRHRNGLTSVSSMIRRCLHPRRGGPGRFGGYPGRCLFGGAWAIWLSRRWSLVMACRSLWWFPRRSGGQWPCGGG